MKLQVQLLIIDWWWKVNLQKTTGLPNTWVILQSILSSEGIAKQHLNSYNEFIQKGLQNIIDESGSIEIETMGNPYRIKFGTVKLGPPRVVEIDGSVSNILPLEGTRPRCLVLSLWMQWLLP